MWTVLQLTCIQPQVLTVNTPNTSLSGARLAFGSGPGQPRCRTPASTRLQASRRDVGAAFGATLALYALHYPLSAAAQDAAANATAEELARQQMIRDLEIKARMAYSERDFQTAVSALSELMYQEPSDPRWSEMRAAALVDGKNFSAAVMDYNEAMQRTPASDKLTLARLMCGRALALEGEGAFEKALDDYEEAQALAIAAGEGYDPYILNSMGNCSASLEQWEDARLSYKLAADTFQSSKKSGGLATALERQDGAVYATTNAALMAAQIGDTVSAKRELEYVSRRAGGNVDSKAALAALYYEEGRTEAAEDMWNTACNRISVGCSKYRDPEWLSKVRRWPPTMVAKLNKFLSLKSA